MLIHFYEEEKLMHKKTQIKNQKYKNSVIIVRIGIMSILVMESGNRVNYCLGNPTLRPYFIVYPSSRTNTDALFPVILIVLSFCKQCLTDKI